MAAYTLYNVTLRGSGLLGDTVIQKSDEGLPLSPRGKTGGRPGSLRDSNLAKLDQWVVLQGSLLNSSIQGDRT